MEMIHMTSAARGIDHIGITVPNLDDASRFLERALGATPMYDSVKRDKPMSGASLDRQLDLAQGTTLVAMRMMKLADGAGIELFEMSGTRQQPPATPGDLGLQHFALRVDDIDAAADRFVAAGGQLVTGPNVMFGSTEADGNKYLYARTPWGTIVELFHMSPTPKT
jgi:catechol 2,3-dioxygenase-like lactoylglutathione lyase family enzyme